MRKLFRLLLLIVLAPFVYAFVVEAFVFVRGNITLESIKWFLYGFGPTLLIYAVLSLGKSPTILFIEVFRHELAHAAVSTLLLRPPTHFLVDIRGTGTRAGGLTGPVGGDFLAVLAPYYLPLFTLPFLLLKPIAPESIQKVIDVLIGVTYAFHLVTGIKDFNWKQPDIKSMGRIFSTVVVILFQIIWLVIILCVVTNNYAGIVSYFKSSVARGLDAYAVVLEAARTKLLPALKRVWEAVRQVWDSCIKGILKRS
jgi:hypothetical protein